MPTDSERLDKLAAFLHSDKCGNGLAIFPSKHSQSRATRICIQDLGSEDGSNLGDDITPLKLTLREAIDALP